MILASVITYSLSKALGKEAAAKRFHAEVERAIVELPGEEVCCQAVRVVRRLRRLAEVAVLHDGGGTSIGHARSRAFSVALAGDVDIWISIDDDTEASADTLRHLVGSIDPHTPQIVIVPCWLRQPTPVVNVTLDAGARLERVSPTGARLRRALYGGFGIVALSRAAIRELARTWEGLSYIDDDGQTRIGLFCEYIRSGCWYRDDFAFFSRVPPHIRIEALLTGTTDHAGHRLALEMVEQAQHIPEPPRPDTTPPPGFEEPLA